MHISRFLSPFCAAAAMLAATAPALADGPISVYAGPQFITQSAARAIAGNTQTDLAVGFDVGPQTIVPVRTTFQLEDSFGQSPNGRIGAFGVGIAARLTTPIYVGLGLDLYNVSVRRNLGLGATTTASGSGIGKNLFVGSKLFSVPGGFSVAIEGSYKAIPSVSGINPSAYGIGVRASL